MKKLLESIDKLTECPPMEGGEMPPAPVNPGNPVTLSVNFNASGKEHVEDLLGMMKNAGLAPAGPAAAPNLPMRQDMDRLRAIVGEPEMEADAAYGDAIEDDLDLEEWDNEPDPEYQDTKYMTKDLSGGINREKKQYKPAAKGDNPMAVETIKKNLMAALQEKKAKPDFLDMDKDGDKKEPMKKAIADKKKKGPVKESEKEKDDELSNKLFKRKPGELDKLSKEKNRAMNQKRFMKPGKPSRSREWGAYESENEAEVQAPSHEMSDIARKAASMAQIIKRKINSGEEMDDRDYNQMAELGAVLSRVGTSFGPKSMKDVMAHMVQYTNDRNEEGHGYPEMNLDRFKELIAMAKSTGESMVGEISSELARNYYRKASKDIGDQARSADDYRDGSLALKRRLDRKYNRDGSRTTDDDRKKDKDTISKYDASRKNAERKIKNRATGIGNAAKRM